MYRNFELQVYEFHHDPIVTTGKGHPTMLPGFSDIAAARQRLNGHAIRTPLLENAALNERAGGRVLIKPEVLQRTGSFKFRGAYNRITQIQDENPGTPIVAFSSGNHAQGVAAAAHIHGVKSTIVMPSDAPDAKLDRTRAYGAKVVLYERKDGDRNIIAQQIAHESNAVIVPPYDDPGVIAGQGTVGLEILEDCKRLELDPGAVLVPCSGGGLAAGIVLSVQELAPDMSVYTVEPENFDDHARSLASGKIERNATLSGSICDALMSSQPGKITFDINGTGLAGGLVVTDAMVLEAVAFATRELKLVVEPGGVVALAALLSGVFSLDGRPVVIVLSGGNIDPDILKQALALAE